MLHRPRKRAALAAAALVLALGACADDPTGPLGPGGPRLDEDVVTEPAEGEEGVVTLAAFTGNIRIGVVPDAPSVTLGAAGDWTIRNKSTGAVLMTGTGGTATVTLQSTSVTIVRLQVMCSANAATVAARKAAGEAAGYPTFTEFFAAGNCTRLYIGELPGSSTTTQRNNLKSQLVAQGLAAADAFYRSFVIGATLYRVARGAASATSQAPPVLSSADGLVTIGGLPYRGVAEAVRNSLGTLAGVNEVHIEQYLYGVVPRELPPTIWNQLEAQKAQAVAARTYALSGLGKRANNGYDLLATTSDQVYGGYSAEHPLSTQAVDETAGIVATYDGNLIEALFSSTAGGYTANNEDVFNSAPVPYLRGVRDHQHGSSEHVLDEIRRHPNPQSLRGKKNGDFEADWSSRHRWTFEWTAEEISEVVGDFAQQDVGKVLEINVLERSNSGRVLRIEYVTEAGRFFDTKDHVRTSLKFFDANGVKSSLFSTLFLIEPVVDRRTGEVTGFTVFGGGWGHGVGLCQTGAAGMADKGATYEEILKHYYQGIELTQWY
ncbi:MAG TPA: SpoIID/LytB domain-containing protein [Longimicrobium sp.]|jgi:SpoIID/LytB domain protein